VGRWLGVRNIGGNNMFLIGEKPPFILSRIVSVI
jgi:hypothetical protein